ncbi:MAG TPA: type II secretion system protein [Thermoanaerobaculia bacterium]|jgi:type II secretory pathway pseudopilin PulG|nr:type II secretion system protein [Thermoanaerobaculia bacterium]
MSRTTSSDKDESGFTLAALIVILTIISIVIAHTVPQQWSMVMKRERDRQTIFLMKQFARGIQRFQQKHNNTAPVSMQQLQDARKPLMLRNGGKWPCPLTGKEDDWILVPQAAVMQNGQVAPPVQGRNPATNPQQQQPQLGDNRAPSKLNKELSPKDYVGAFVGVRPNAQGKSFIEFNGATDYSEWVYTVFDLQQEMAARQASLVVQ